MEPSDEILARAQAGDAEAREQLLIRELPGLHAWFRVHCGELVRGRESIGDLVQSVCREALQDLAGVQCEAPGSFRAWLYGVARNKLLRKAEHHGALRRNPARETDARPDDAEHLALQGFASFCTPSREAASHEELLRIERALASLTPDDRELILESRLVGRSAREIGDASGRSEVAVRKALSRAVARLGIALRGRGSEGSSPHDGAG